MLGKIQPDYFPAIFGENGDEKLDRDVVAEQFAGVANMANAIKKISVQRGYDVTGYVLNCFGGAAGQHACLVADALGVRRVLLHPLAGVLSAYGMGLADVRAMREAQLDLPFDHRTIRQAIAERCTSLEAAAAEELQAQGVDPQAIGITRKVHLRYEGTDTSLLVDLASAPEMQAAFEAE